MLAPYKGRIYDPCCGSGGMFVQSGEVRRSPRRPGRRHRESMVSESNATTRRLALMNLALRGIEADSGPGQADTFRRDYTRTSKPSSSSRIHPSTTQIGLARMTTCAGLTRPAPKAIELLPGCSTSFITLAPVGMGPGLSSPTQHVVESVRRKADPSKARRGRPRGLHGRHAGQLFYSTQIPRLPLVFATKAGSANREKAEEDLPEYIRDLPRETLFIMPPRWARLIDRVHRGADRRGHREDRTHLHLCAVDLRGFSKEALKRRVCIEPALPYADIPGSVRRPRQKTSGGMAGSWTPGRYVGTEALEDDGEPFQEKMTRARWRTGRSSRRVREAGAEKADPKINAARTGVW